MFSSAFLFGKLLRITDLIHKKVALVKKVLNVFQKLARDCPLTLGTSFFGSCSCQSTKACFPTSFGVYKQKMSEMLHRACAQLKRPTTWSSLKACLLSCSNGNQGRYPGGLSQRLPKDNNIRKESFAGLATVRLPLKRRWRC